MPHAATEFLTTIQCALGGDAKSVSRVEFTGEGALPSVFAVTDLAAGSIGAAALAVREYADAGAAMTPAVSVDRLDGVIEDIDAAQHSVARVGGEAYVFGGHGFTP